MKQHTNMKLALFSLAIQGLIQNLNFGDNMNVSIRWSIKKKTKRYRQRQIGLFVFCFMFSLKKYPFFKHELCF